MAVVVTGYVGLTTGLTLGTLERVCDLSPNLATAFLQHIPRNYKPECFATCLVCSVSSIISFYKLS